jgi:hypothetical protein
MNRETRTFIWGLLVVYICASGLGLQIRELMSRVDFGWFDWIFLILNLLGVISGLYSIYKTVD